MVTNGNQAISNMMVDDEADVNFITIDCYCQLKDEHGDEKAILVAKRVGFKVDYQN